mmetsp:Transcript_157944/g.484052  ORF Transcript_157944/g.484052 Transcript_157944/m.484052 type:complete len:402 (+) Transcript_157944:194-1399(+)
MRVLDRLGRGMQRLQLCRISGALARWTAPPRATGWQTQVAGARDPSLVARRRSYHDAPHALLLGQQWLLRGVARPRLLVETGDQALRVGPAGGRLGVLPVGSNLAGQRASGHADLRHLCGGLRRGGHVLHTSQNHGQARYPQNRHRQPVEPVLRGGIQDNPHHHRRDQLRVPQRLPADRLLHALQERPAIQGLLHHRRSAPARGLELGCGGRHLRLPLSLRRQRLLCLLGGLGGERGAAPQELPGGRRRVAIEVRRLARAPCASRVLCGRPRGIGAVVQRLYLRQAHAVGRGLQRPQCGCRPAGDGGHAVWLRTAGLPSRWHLPRPPVGAGHLVYDAPPPLQDDGERLCGCMGVVAGCMVRHHRARPRQELVRPPGPRLLCFGRRACCIDSIGGPISRGLW